METDTRFHSYIFFDRAPWSKQTKITEATKNQFVNTASSDTHVRIESYGTLGMRAGSRFMLHVNTTSPERVQEFVSTLLHTPLGEQLSVSYSLHGMTKPSQYNPDKSPVVSEPNVPHTYLIVYPFTKTEEWHLLPYDVRRGMMQGHVNVGRKYSDDISQLLLYSFGIDDHEFIVSYQTDHLERFQDLVMELRSTEARRYTKNDTPIFTCIHMPLKGALSML